jgi:AcrR family transcriptional regulator
MPDMRDRILSTAMRMVEEGDVEALTMRKLAAELGVAPTAIYWHVGNKGDLLDLLVDRLITEMGHPEPTGETGMERMAWIARWIRRQVQARPHLVGIAHQQGRDAEVFFAAQRALADELSAAGVGGADAALAVRSVAFSAGAFILLEQSLRTRTGADGAGTDDNGPAHGHPTSRQLWTDAAAGGVDPELAQRLAHPVDYDELFEFTLDALLSALTDDRSPGRAPAGAPPLLHGGGDHGTLPDE